MPGTAVALREGRAPGGRCREPRVVGGTLVALLVRTVRVERALLAGPVAAVVAGEAHAVGDGGAAGRGGLVAGARRREVVAAVPVGQARIADCPGEAPGERGHRARRGGGTHAAPVLAEGPRRALLRPLGAGLQLERRGKQQQRGDRAVVAREYRLRAHDGHSKAGHRHDVAEAGGDGVGEEQRGDSDDERETLHAWRVFLRALYEHARRGHASQAGHGVAGEVPGALVEPLGEHERTQAPCCGRLRDPETYGHHGEGEIHATADHACRTGHARGPSTLEAGVAKALGHVGSPGQRGRVRGTLRALVVEAEGVGGAGFARAQQVERAPVADAVAAGAAPGEGHGARAHGTRTDVASCAEAVGAAERAGPARAGEARVAVAVCDASGAWRRGRVQRTRQLRRVRAGTVRAGRTLRTLLVVDTAEARQAQAVVDAVRPHARRRVAGAGGTQVQGVVGL